MISLVLTLYFAVVADSFIGTLIFFILELVALAYFIGSFFPGGREGVSHFFKTLCTGITSCCNKKENDKSNSSSK